MFELVSKKTFVGLGVVLLSALGTNSASATTLSTGDSVGTAVFNNPVGAPNVVNIGINGSAFSSIEIIASEATASAIVGVPIDFSMLPGLDSVELFQTAGFLEESDSASLSSLSPLVTFTNLTVSSIVTSLNAGSNFFVFRANTANPNNFLLNAQVSAVPLPAAAWLFLSAMLGLGALGRHRKLHASEL